MIKVDHHIVWKTFGWPISGMKRLRVDPNEGMKDPWFTLVGFKRPYVDLLKEFDFKNTWKKARESFSVSRCNSASIIDFAEN